MALAEGSMAAEVSGGWVCGLRLGAARWDAPWRFGAEVHNCRACDLRVCDWISWPGPAVKLSAVSYQLLATCPVGGSKGAPSAVHLVIGNSFQEFS